MGLLSSIGNAIGGLAKKILPVAAPLAAVALPGIGSTLGAVGSVLANNVGPIIGGAAQYFSAKDVNAANLEIADQATAFNRESQLIAQDFNERMADKATAANSAFQLRQFGENERLVNQAMAFDERMSSTAYQRAIMDMKAAGVNPILAASQGGASSPSAPTGSAGSTSAVSASSPGSSAAILPQVEKLGPALNTAIHLKKVGTELDAIRAQTALNKASAKKVETEAEIMSRAGKSHVATEVEGLRRGAVEIYNLPPVQRLIDEIQSNARGKTAKELSENMIEYGRALARKAADELFFMRHRRRQRKEGKR